MRLRPVSTAQGAAEVAALAAACWRHHYPPIIGSEQVEYMLERFQSAPAISGQLAEGRQYHMIEDDAGPLGYLAFDLAPDHLFLSKLYILPTRQRCGAGRWAVEQLAERHPDLAIHLTVNKHNHDTIAFYEKVGFMKDGPTVADIGNGYVMDDWKMVRRSLSNP